MLIAYAEKSKAFKLLDEENHAVVVSGDIVFAETAKGSPASNISSKFVTFDTHQIYLDV